MIRNILLWLGIPALWLAIFAMMLVPSYRQINVPDAYPRVILPVEGVDPFDLLRGDYVILRYPFSQSLVDESITSPEDWRRQMMDIAADEAPGASIYLGMDTSGTPATITSATVTKPETGLFIRAELRGHPGKWRSRAFRAGIETYFVPHGKGWYLEDALRDRQAQVELAIDPNTGKALIANMLINGEPIDFSKVEKR